MLNVMKYNEFRSKFQKLGASSAINFKFALSASIGLFSKLFAKMEKISRVIIFKSL